MWTFSRETYYSQNFRYETLKSSLSKETKCIPLILFPVKVTNDWWYIFVIFTHQRMNEYEWIWMNIWLNSDASEGVQRAITLFRVDMIYFRNPFCHRIKNSWGFRYRILGHVGLLGKTLIFCLPCDNWNFKIFWAFCLYWSCPSQNFSMTLWAMPLLQILKLHVWSFII